MRHDLTLEGEAFALRPIAVRDAEAVIALRTAPGRSDFVHPISPNTEDQVAWIENYFERAGDYYFAVEEKRNLSFEGTIAIYDRSAADAEWGRWVLRGDSLAASESVLLVFRLAMETLNIERLFCRTLVENEKVISFHDRCGLRNAGVLAGAFQIDGRPRDAILHELTAANWPRVRERLAQSAAKVAVLLRRRQLC